MSDTAERLEARWSGMETRMTTLEAKYEHLATKEDVANAQSSLLKWIGGMMLSTAALTVTVGLLIQRMIS